MGCHDAQFAYAVLYHRVIVAARILNVVDVVHRESRGDGFGILAFTILKDGVRGKHRQLLLHRRLVLVKLGAGCLASLNCLKLAGNLSAHVHYLC